jgi:hypothetical protein
MSLGTLINSQKPSKPLGKLLLKQRKSPTMIAPRHMEESPSTKSIRRKAIPHISGLKPGVEIKCSWAVPENYGGGRQTFRGTVDKVDTWLMATSANDIRLHLPLSMLKVEVI